MTEYWIVKPDEIKNLDADSLSPLSFRIFVMVNTSKNTKVPTIMLQIKWPM